MANNLDPSSTSKKVSLAAAFREKYIDDDDEPSPSDDGIFIAMPSRKSGSSPYVPQCLTLNACHINCAGDDGEIKKLCSRVKELDLTQNKLEDWKEVFSILRQLPQLYFLNLSSNPLTQPLLKDCVENVSLMTIKKLVLNNTKIQWDKVHLLLSVMPQLEELHLSLNGYDEIDVCETPHPSVKMLQFNSNHTTDFQQICKLGKIFPKLEHLYLLENNIKRLSGDVDNFPNLKYIGLSDNEIENWDELEKLNAFPVLVDVRLKGIPFLDQYPQKERRSMIIARLPRVTRLNGSKVSETEREDAERGLIRYYMKKELKEQPQRYHDLVKVYGKLDELVEIDMSANQIVTCLVKIANKQTIMKVDTRKTVLEFKTELEPLVGLAPNRYRLIHFDHEMIGTGYGANELRTPNRRLNTFRVQDQDEFQIEKRWNWNMKKWDRVKESVFY